MKKIFLLLLVVLCLANASYSQTWMPFGPGVDNRVNALTIFNNELVAGGWFTIAGEKDVCRVARWNGTGWAPVGSNSHLINTLCSYNNALYSGSNFGILKYDGTTWSTPGSGLDNSVYSLTVYNNELIAAGDFTTAGTTNASKIAKWNDTAWAPLGTGLSGTAYAVTVFNNELIVGGKFTSAGGLTANNIAKWDGTSWSYLSSGVNDTVFALTVYNGSLIAGGSFSTAGGISANYIAKWNGTNWSTLGSGMSASVRCFILYNNELVAGGDFITAGGTTVNRIARWNTNYTISGFARYADNNLPATNGSVKAVKVDRYTGNLIVYDSTQINPDGSYTLTKVPQDSVDIGVYPNSNTQNDWVMTYHPSTIYWQNAVTLYPTGNLTNINIGVFRLFAVTAGNSVNGKVRSVNPVGNLKDAMLYAKIGNSFVRCATSDANGVYHLLSLPTGVVKIIVNRLGYSGDSTSVTMTATSNIDSVNFALNRITIGIRQIENIIPSEYKLYQNYPNPFNPNSIIRFQIKDSKMVTLKIFDILGKEIATLISGNYKPGTYEISFDGSSLPSGVYFYRLTAGDFTETRKMALIK